MKSTLLERILVMVVLGLIGLCIGLSICLINERQQRQKYEEAACLLSDVCRMSLDSENLDLPGFEDRYYDVLDNLDCYNMHVDREFIENLYWCY